MKLQVRLSFVLRSMLAFCSSPLSQVQMYGCVALSAAQVRMCGCVAFLVFSSVRVTFAIFAIFT